MSTQDSSEITTTTEQTRLLNTTTTSYTTSRHVESGATSQTVITMTQENGGYHQGSSSRVVSHDQYQNVILSGQPKLPAHQLPEKIQDILVFSEIKKKQEQQQKDRKVGGDEGIAVVPGSSSDSDSDDDVGDKLKKKLSEWSLNHDGKVRKRDLVVDALRFATDKWKDNHGYDQQQVIIEQTTVSSPTSKNTTTPSHAESVFDVAKNASVCAVLALLHEHKQSSGHSAETDLSLQSLALSTLTLGLKAQDTSASRVVLYEMLTTKWTNGKSALEWAVENNSQLILSDARVQSVIEELWLSGPNWRQDPHHPSYIWLSQASISLDGKAQQNSSKNFVLFVVTRTLVDFLAKWPSIRYQAMIGLFTFFVYLALHFATLGNVEYTSDSLFAFEYVYYFFVLSDVLLELYKFWLQPLRSLKKVSFYLTWLTLGLLSASFIIRIFTLIFVHHIEYEVYLLTISFSLLVLATPLMFYRLFLTATDLSWSTAKVHYILHQCFVNSVWVFTVGFFVILSFWIALSALQFNDVRPLTMLRFLVLGALHAPQIGNTLYYQPTIAGLLLAIYLFFTVIILTALLTASFITTILEVNKRLDSVKREWVIDRCLRTNPIINVFIPSVLVDLTFGIVRWFSRVVLKRQQPVIWVEKTHQVFWYIIYSPIILLIGLYELITTLIFRWSLVSKAFKKTTVILP